MYHRFHLNVLCKMQIIFLQFINERETDVIKFRKPVAR